MIGYIGYERGISTPNQFLSCNGILVVLGAELSVFMASRLLQAETIVNCLLEIPLLL